MEEESTFCEDCLAHDVGPGHQCPEWMRMLVLRMRARNRKAQREYERTGKRLCLACSREMAKHSEHEFSCVCSPGTRVFIG